MRGCGWAGVGKTEQEELTCEGVGGEEVEAAGEACECHVLLEVEGGEPKFEHKEGECGEGDTKGVGEGFVEGFIEDDKGLE